jgi:hypothetical protein
MATDTPLVAVRQYIDAFNDADAELMADTFDAWTKGTQ